MPRTIELTVPVVLRDGTRGIIRDIRPEDREPIRQGYLLLSEESQFHRFLSPMPELTDSMLDLLIDGVDFVDHSGLRLEIDTPDGPAGVAVARVVRLPDAPDAADVAVTVLDEWQGRGAATALLAELMRQRPEGIVRLKTVVTADNTASLAMLARLGEMTTSPPEQGIIEVEIALPPDEGRPAPDSAGAGPRWPDLDTVAS